MSAYIDVCAILVLQSCCYTLYRIRQVGILLWYMLYIAILCVQDVDVLS